MKVQVRREAFEPKIMMLLAAFLVALVLVGCAGGSVTTADEQLTASEKSLEDGSNEGNSDSPSINQNDEAALNGGTSESSVAAVGSDIPATYLYYRNTDGAGSDNIVCLDGSQNLQPASFSVDGADSFRIQGPFREGVAFAEFTTSSYDQEWDEKVDEQKHYGFVDPSGKIALDLSDLLNGFSVDNLPYFFNGKAVIVAHNLEDYAQKTICIDSSGTQLWDVPGSAGPEASAFYENGVVVFDGDSQIVVNESGDTVFNADEVSGSLGYIGHCFNAGEGLIMVYLHDSYDPIIIDYSGNVVFDPAVRFADYSVAKIEEARFGTAIVKLIQESPNGTGKTKEFMGLWSIIEDKWLVEPIEDAWLGQIVGPDLVWFDVTGRDGADDFLHLYALDGNPITLPDGTNKWPGSHYFSAFLDNGWYYLFGGEDAGFVHVGNKSVDSIIETEGYDDEFGHDLSVMYSFNY